VLEKPKLPFPVKDNISLAGLLELGQNDPDRAWPVFQVFWKELTANEGKRPPVMMCLDNLTHVTLKSKYQVLDQAGKLTQVHAHDLALIQHFLSHLSGATSLPNGGVVLAATSASDAPRSDAMDVGIAVAETRQNISRNPDSKTSTPYKTAYTELQKLSPTCSTDPTALSNFWSPFQPIDQRVVSLFTQPSSNLEIVRLPGLSQPEATALMKYWTLSGMHRGCVLPWTVQEARALSGGAVVGELEMQAVRFLQRELVGVENEPGGGRIRVH
jgi:small subunit ribosomal protein S29